MVGDECWWLVGNECWWVMRVMSVGGCRVWVMSWWVMSVGV